LEWSTELWLSFYGKIERHCRNEKKKSVSFFFHCLIRNRWKPIKLFVFFFFLCWRSMSESRKTTFFICGKEKVTLMGQSLVVFCMLGEKEMDARIEKKKARAPPNIICNTLITMTTTTKREREREKLFVNTDSSIELDSNSFARLRHRQHQRIRTRENLPYDNLLFFLFSFSLLV